MTIRNVPGTGFAELLVNAGDGPTMVINRDETHQLFVGDDNSVASKQGTGEIDIIDPLSYIVYDGISSKYGIADTPGITVQVDSVKGATNWAPSPAQAALQISLLGLATASNQNTQIGHEANTDTNTNSTTQALFGTSFGVPSALVDTAGMSVMDTIYGRVNLLANGDFRRGTATWSTTNCTQNVVSSGLPNGWPRKFGNQLTPSGSATSLQLNGPTIPCTPGQIISARGWFNQAARAVSESVQMQLRFVDSTNTVIATVSSTKAVFLNQVQHLDMVGSSILPTVAGVRLIIVYTGASGNIPAADVLTVGDLSVHSGTVAGMPSTANDIANTGVPLLAFSNTELGSTTSTIAISGTAVDGPFTVTQPNYELYVSAIWTGAPLGRPLTVNLTWTDTASGLVLDSETYSILPGAFGGTPHQVTIRGITKANSVTITYSNLDSGVSLSVTRALFMNSRNLQRNICKSLNSPTLWTGAPFVNGYGNIATNIIADYFNASVAASGQAFVLGAMYNGDVKIQVATGIGVNAPTLALQVYDLTDLLINGIASSAPLYQGRDTNGQLEVFLSLPRQQCAYAITNETASAHAVNLKVIAREEGT